MTSPRPVGVGSRFTQQHLLAYELLSEPFGMLREIQLPNRCLLKQARLRRDQVPELLSGLQVKHGRDEFVATRLSCGRV